MFERAGRLIHEALKIQISEDKFPLYLEAAEKIGKSVNVIAREGEIYTMEGKNNKVLKGNVAIEISIHNSIKMHEFWNELEKLNNESRAQKGDIS